ncbi:MAG: hypothetical protein SO434_01740 [Eubacteriales bacterium]|nr:hypothetical protein [Eubacteriales bacterium]
MIARKVQSSRSDGERLRHRCELGEESEFYLYQSTFWVRRYEQDKESADWAIGAYVTKQKRKLDKK